MCVEKNIESKSQDSKSSDLKKKEILFFIFESNRLSTDRFYMSDFNVCLNFFSFLSSKIS